MDFKKKRRKLILVVLTICLVVVLSFTSYALNQMKHNTILVEENFNDNNLDLAILVDGKKVDAFPTKSSGKIFEKIECTNGGTAKWDSATWKLSVTGIKRSTKCTVYFKAGVIVENAVEKLTKLAQTNKTEMFTDEYGNIRYVGKNPTNYIDLGNGNYSEGLYVGYTKSHMASESFTSLEACQQSETYNTDCTKIHDKGEPILWRAIGVMKNVSNGTKEEVRIKVIREESIGEYNWDSNGKNNWATSSLQELLNNSYYYSTGSFANNGITQNMKSLIEDAVYYLGGTDKDANSTYYAQAATAEKYYQIERSNNVYGSNPSTWKGKIGLMYPSDYGFATSETICATKALRSWYQNSDCYLNNWIGNIQKDDWTITPSASEDASATLLSLGSMVFQTNVSPNGDMLKYEYNARPVMYLKSSVKILSGEGTKDNPYKIGI